MKLSIAMIVKDEGENLERTLISLKKLQNYIDTEIVIVDTGSTDNTIDIAKGYTDKVYFHKWNNDFSAMRNISINYCSGDWVLVVDADEELYDVKELADLINNKKFNKYNSAFIKIIDFSKSKENSIINGSISPILRLFKKNTVKYEGIVHEQPKYKGNTLDTNIRFIHYGYDNNNYELMEYKFHRNIKLLFKQLYEKPSDVYINFQIATSYLMHKDLINALKYIEIAYDLAYKNGLSNYVYVIDKYCLILHTLKRYDDLINKTKEGIEYCNNFIDFYFYLGEAYNNLNQYDKAIESYEMYLNLYKNINKNINKNNILSRYSISSVTIEYKNIVIYHLALCYYKNKIYEKSLKLILTIDDINFLKDKILTLCKIITEGKLWGQFYVLNDFIDKHNYEDILLFFHQDVLFDEISKINIDKINNDLKQMINTIKYVKENGKINENYLTIIKEVIDRNKIPYTIYVYYVLKYDINEFEYFIDYGKDKLQSIFAKLSFTFYDFGDYLQKNMNEFKEYNIFNIVKKNIIREALLNSRKIPLNKRKILFLNFIADKYFFVLKTRNMDIIYENLWMLSSEERFIVELKETLSYKYKDTLKYIKGMKDILNVEKTYIDYVKLLIEEDEKMSRNSEMKVFIPRLVQSIQELINTEKYQEAYNIIEEGLSLVNFDCDLMMLKYNLLINFNYEEEAIQCLREIILYGDVERVNKLIDNL
ncbi:glycosyltransferase family 2 protein [Clostridium sporogenes]|uniref:Glycosyltransferase family 2 protein n=1 Tax=Clostridium sporogenes TaxID=1509 RepID=A0A7X5P690_CLOSG|nr:glycosyltransferase family 2 protein [Clostridium sporogenes]AJD30095.1 glycosyl transferase 2 family protein [Clostridium botulinum Prevot_594]NFQ15405.1 glycosyltransferase family 2 protein [Clostridium sporogenes]NFQ19420.1 glycosyltransferase family 2 protein [Clostridium sporogenes]NFQ27948.1 glycosyltransferase family 2 protein [Clostridium sporogenes]NFR60133.1 glycosyltransferase family 2 protein [Clostridium sporogenes]